MYGKMREKYYDAAVELRMMGLSLRQIGQKIGISHTSVRRMLRNFDPDNEFEVEEMKVKKEPVQSQSKSRERLFIKEIAALKAELRQTRKERDFQSLRAEAFDEMINIAEREFNIEIRKKSGVKR